MRTPNSRKKVHSPRRSPCMSGSPPESTTHRTPSLRKESRCRSRSAAVISEVVSRFQISHITHRQLHRLCAFKIRIGSSVRICLAVLAELETGASVVSDTLHPLSANLNWASQRADRFLEQLRHRSAQPDSLAVHFQGFQTLAQLLGHTVQNRIARKPHLATENNELDVMGGEVGQNFSGIAALIADGNQIGDAIKLDGALAIPHAKYPSRSGVDHFVNPFGGDTCCAGKADIVKQISGRGERGVASEYQIVNRGEEIAVQRTPEQETIRRRTPDDRSAALVYQRRAVIVERECVHQNRSVVQQATPVKFRELFRTAFIYPFACMDDERLRGIVCIKEFVATSESKLSECAHW